jgi:phage virion morphogenesis protein
MYTLEINSGPVDGALERLAAGLDDTTPAMQRIGEFLAASTKDRFPTGTAPDGSAWAPKSPTTLARYGARSSNSVDHRPLYGPSGQLSTRIFYEASRNQVRIGSPMIYAAVMQFGAAKGAFGKTSRGGPIPWGTIPARPFLGLSISDETGIVEIVEEYLSGLAAP